jgi:iron complex outermembrane receptor protein
MRRVFSREEQAMSLFKMSLLASASLALCATSAIAQSVDSTTPDDQAEQRREMDTVVIIGQAQTYSSAESTEAMALQQAPVSSILAQVDNLPGVLVSEGDTFGFDDWSTGIAVRGFQNNLGEQQIGITVDGLPNGGSNYGGGSKANRYIDTQNAGAIEVSQGTADIASLSNDALGGTINFTTRNPEDEERVRVSGTLGDFEAQRFYLAYDTGSFLNDTTKAWFSVSSQTATDHIEGSADNRRDHYAAKLVSTLFDIDWTAYASYDDAAENNYDQLYSEADWQTDPNSDRLIGNWTGVPYVDQSYRQVWGTLRENSLLYLKAEKDVAEGLRLKGGVYLHNMDGRGDWAPPYLVNVTDDGAGNAESEFLGGERVMGGSLLGQLFFVDPNGVALSPEPGCQSSLTFPYGGTSNAAYDPACYPANAIPVSSYRHTHYQRERYGITADVEWTKTFDAFENMLRGGIWYEDGTRYEYRDWHRIIDSRVGPEFDSLAYWVQYDREFPQNTFKWYVEDVVSFGDFTIRAGVKQFNNSIDRVDNFDPQNPDKNFTLDSESDVLFSGGASWAPSAVPGLEMFVGYAENYKAIPDSVLEVINVDAGIPDPETSENTEVGFRYSNGRLRGSLVYFDTTFENRLFPAPTATVEGIDYLEASNGGYINGGGIDSTGVELASEFLLNDNLTFFGSYTHNDAKILGTGDSVLDGLAGIAVGNKVPGIPDDMFVLSADFTKGNFYGGASAKWVGDRFVNLSNTWTADSYVDTDLYLGVSGSALSDDLSNIDFRLTVNNVFDQDWLAGISGNAAWISAPRTVALTITADF